MCYVGVCCCDLGNADLQVVVMGVSGCAHRLVYIKIAARGTLV